MLLQNYVEGLEERGYLALGDLYVRTLLNRGAYYYDIFTLTETHHIQANIHSVKIKGSESVARNALFGSNSVFDLSEVCVLSDLVSKNPRVELEITNFKHLPDLNTRYIDELGRNSLQRKLIYHLGLNILTLDICSPEGLFKNFVPEVEERFLQLLKMLPSPFINAENALHLARATYFSLEEASEFLQHPHSWVSKAFEAGEDFSVISLPNLDFQSSLGKGINSGKVPIRNSHSVVI